MKALLERLGWPGIAGLGLLLFSLVFYVVSVAPVMDEVDTQKEEKARLQSAQGMQPGAASAGASPPTLAETPALLAQIAALASESGIRLERTQSQIEDSDSGPRMTIRLPTKAAYPALRRYLALLAIRLPAITLDDISLERSNSSEATLEADIRISFPLARST